MVSSSVMSAHIYEFTIKEELVKHKIEKHDSPEASESVDNDKSQSEEELVCSMEMDDLTTAKVLAEKATVEGIVNSFVKNAYRVMNPEEQIENTSCHNCDLKDEVIIDKDSIIDRKENIIEEKTATVKGLLQRVKKLEEERTSLKKKVEQTDKLKETVSTKNKEISNLKVQINTKDQLLAHTKTDTGHVDLLQENEAVDVKSAINACLQPPT